MGGATADIHNRFMIFRLISYVGNHLQTSANKNHTRFKYDS